MFIAWRDLRFARGRFALMGTVVVLITVLVGLLSGLTSGLGRESTSAVTGLPADHLAFSAPSTGAGASFTDSTVTAAMARGWAGVPGVRAAEPLGVTTTKATAGDRSAALSVFGVRPGSGLSPARVAPGAAVLSSGAAGDLGVSTGGTVTVAGRRLTVAAVSGDASYSHTPVVWTDLSDWRAAAHAAPGTATALALTTGAGADLAAADHRMGTVTLARDDAVSAIASYGSENGSLQLMRGFLLAISALVIGAFFTVWTIQRSGDIAVLKALGASTGYLLRDALGQAAVLLAAGTAVGSAIAAAAGAAARGTVPFVLDVPTIGVPAAAMIALGLLGAALSLRRVTAVDPLTALGAAR